MNHRVFGNRLSRPVDKQKELRKTLVDSLFRYGKIETTVAKAKAIRADVDGLILMAKKQTMAAKTYLQGFLPKDTAKKLYTEALSIFKSRNSGFTRILKLGQRLSDGSQMVIMQLIRDDSHPELVSGSQETKAENTVEEPKKKMPKQVRHDKPLKTKKDE